jgi:hypothetical protein
MSLAIIDFIRRKMRNREYEFAVPHFFEEMADDGMDMSDVESVVLNGRIRRRFTRDLCGARHEVVGPATDGRQVAVICRIKETGKLLLITTYALE